MVESTKRDPAQQTRSRSDVQKVVNAINRASQSTRSDYHLTLGQLLRVLRRYESVKNALVLVQMPDGRRLSISGDEDSLHSYRGYYSDLALTPTHGEPITLRDLLVLCEAALGGTFEGYKGGGFTMEEDTPLWIATHGYATQVAVMACEMADVWSGPLVLATKKIGGNP